MSIQGPRAPNQMQQTNNESGFHQLASTRTCVRRASRQCIAPRIRGAPVWRSVQAWDVGDWARTTVQGPCGTFHFLNGLQGTRTALDRLQAGLASRTKPDEDRQLVNNDMLMEARWKTDLWAGAWCLHIRR